MSSLSPASSSSRRGAGTPIEADSPSNLESTDDDSSQDALDSAFKFEEENGRTYHGYRPGTYHFPNDSTETERLDFQHELIKQVFHGKNHFAPLTNPLQILDIGTGTGQWAIEIGDAFPGASVQGTDLSPIQPLSVPENVHFFVDDASEKDWAVPPGYFDYIHTRVLLGCFTDFGEILKRAFYYTKPGGWMESQEVMITPYCDDGTMPSNCPLIEWLQYCMQAAEEANRPLKMAHKLKKWYEDAGFVDVQEKIFKVPINPWPKDKHLKMLGRMAEENMLAGLSAFSLAYFSRILRWTKTEIEVYLVNVRKTISDRRIHAYHHIYVVWGRKPFEGETMTPPP